MSRVLGSRQAGCAPARLSRLELQAAGPPALRSGLAAALVLEQGRSQSAGHTYARPSCICTSVMNMHVYHEYARSSGCLSSHGLGLHSLGRRLGQVIWGHQLIT